MISQNILCGGYEEAFLSLLVNV